ncbi:MAG: protein kinase, partial [Chloroflexaceae bacterium]|nr:protein kinase [Chloroflexaceae bacterium]
MTTGTAELQLIGRTLGNYIILAEAGRGGMAVVYQARDTRLDRIVALKMLLPQMAYDSAAVERFHQEARNAARLDHPHIVTIYETGELPYLPGVTLHYIAMRYIDGTTARAMLLQRGRMSLAEATALLAQVGGALDYAHRRGLIHRDIKPSNILIGRDGTAYLSDFGLAIISGSTGGLTRTGTVIGTPEYMSPEQAQGQTSLTPASDVYALGIVLYELLTGALPFESDTPVGLLVARLMHEPRPLRELRDDLAPQVEQLVQRALTRDPAARFQSAGEFVAALHHAGAHFAAPAETQVLSVPPAHTGATIALAQPPATPAPSVSFNQRQQDAPSFTPLQRVNNFWLIGTVVAVGVVLLLYTGRWGVWGALMLPLVLLLVLVLTVPLLRTAGWTPFRIGFFRVLGAAMIAGSMAVAIGVLVSQSDTPAPSPPLIIPTPTTVAAITPTKPVQMIDPVLAGGQAALNVGDYDSAVAQFERVVALDPNNIEGTTLLADALVYRAQASDATNFDKNRAYERAIALYERHLPRIPSMCPPISGLAGCSSFAASTMRRWRASAQHWQSIPRSTRCTTGWAGHCFNCNATKRRSAALAAPSSLRRPSP